MGFFSWIKEVLTGSVPISASVTQAKQDIINACSAGGALYEQLSTYCNRCSNDFHQYANSYIHWHYRDIESRYKLETLKARHPGRVRLKAIEDAGFHTLADLNGRSEWELERINGVSTVTAMAVLQEYRYIHEQICRLMCFTSLKN